MNRSLLLWLDLPKLCFYTIFVAIMATFTLTDSDFFWHFKAGEWIFEHGEIPSADMFSYTKQGEHWVLHEWLFEVVLYSSFMLGGDFGIKLLCALLAVTTLIITYKSASLFLTNSSIPLYITIIAYPYLSSGLAPRPHLITFLFAVTFLFVILRQLHVERTRLIWSLPLLMIIWVNMHGGFVLGLAMLAIVLISEFVDYKGAGKPAPVWLIRLFYVTAATFAATAINPDGLFRLVFPFQLMGLETATSVISEWQSPDFHSFDSKLYLLVIAAVFVSYVLTREKLGVTDVTIPLFFIAMGLVSKRHIPISVLVCMVFIARVIPRISVADIRLFLRNLFPFDRLLPSDRANKELGQIQFILNWSIAVVVTILGVTFYLVSQEAVVKKSDESLPVGAVNFIDENNIDGRMYNSYGIGGYLIYRLYPKQKVFIDGRADLYGDDFVKDYLQIEYGGPRWESLFNAARVDFAIVDRQAAIRQLLTLREDYALVYDDRRYSVIVKRDAKFKDIIEKYENNSIR
jgi:hypothetical protein